MNRHFLKGRRFSKLTVIKEVGNSNLGSIMWYCVCDCGGNRLVSSNKLVSGKTTHCGCIKQERPKKHGLCSSAEYKAWCAIKDRCYNPKSTSYKYYGAKRISICDRWLKSFMNFYEDMGKKPTPSHSLDRINVHGNYEPSNCRWATQKEQTANTGRNVYLSYNGEIKILSEWARYLGTDYNNITNMMKKRPFDETVKYYLSKKKEITLNDISQYLVF